MPRRRGTFRACLLMLVLPFLQASPAPSCDAGCQHEHQAASLLQDRGERSRQPLPALEQEDAWRRGQGPSNAALSTAPGFSAISIIHDPEPPEVAGGPGADDVVIAKAGDMVIAKGGDELGVAEAAGGKPTYVVIVPRFDHPRTPRSQAPMQVYGDDSGTGWWLSSYTLRDALTFFEYFLMFLFVAYGIRNLTHKQPPSRSLSPQIGEDSFSVHSDPAFSRGLLASTPPAPPSTAAAVAPPTEYRRPPPSEQADAHPMEAMPMPPATTRAPVPFEPVAPMSRTASLRLPAPPLASLPARKHLVETVLVPTPSAVVAWPQGVPLEPRSQSPPPVVRSVTRSLSPGRVIRTTTRSLSPVRSLLPTRQLVVAQPVVVRSFETLPPTAPLAAPQPPAQAFSQPSAFSQPTASEAIEPVMEPMMHS